MHPTPNAVSLGRSKKVVKKTAKKTTKQASTVAQRLNSAVLSEKNWAFQAFKAFGELEAFKSK